MSGVGWGGFGGSERRGIPPIRMKPRMDGAPGHLWGAWARVGVARSRSRARVRFMLARLALCEPASLRDMGHPDFGLVRCGPPALIHPAEVRS